MVRAQLLPLACAALLSCVCARADLGGRVLRCCYMIEEPYVVPDITAHSSANVSGLAITYLTLLERRLNFSCDLKPYQPVQDQFAGFTGFIRGMNDCATDGDSSACTCDLGVGAWAVSSERYHLVDFISSFSAEGFRAVTRTSAVRDSAATNIFFLQAFTWPVWFAIFSLIALHMFVTMFDNNFFPRTNIAESSAPRHSWWQRQRFWLMKSKLPFRLRMSFFNTSVHFIGQYVQADSHKTGTKTKLMNLIGLMIGVFLLTIFQASITVQVLTEVPLSEFGAIADVKSCRIAADRMCFVANGASQNFFDVAVQPSQCIEESGLKPTIVSSFNEGFEFVMSGKCDFYYTLQGQVLSQSRGRWCNRLSAVGKPFFETAVSFVLPKNSSLTLPLSLETLVMREEDKLESSKEFAERQECPDITDPTLDWSKLKYFFYLAWAGLGGMLLLMLLDKGQTLPTHDIKNDRIDAESDIVPVSPGRSRGMPPPPPPPPAPAPVSPVVALHPVAP